MSQPVLSYLPGFFPNLAVTSIAPNLPVPLCVVVVAEGSTISSGQITAATHVIASFSNTVAAVVDTNLRESDPAMVAFRASTLSGTVARVWFTPPQSSPFEFRVGLSVGMFGYTLGATSPMMPGTGTESVWSYSSGVALATAPNEPTYYPSGLPNTTDTSGVTWYFAPVYPSVDATTTVLGVAACTAATFVVSGGIPFNYESNTAFSFGYRPLANPLPYELDVWEVVASNVGKDDLLVTQAFAGPNNTAFSETAITVYVKQSVVSDRSGSCFIKAFIGVRDVVNRTVTIPIVIVCLANPTPIIQHTPSVYVVGGAWLCAMPSEGDSIQLLEAGWDADSTVPSQRPLELPGSTALGFTFTTAVTTTATLNSAITSGHSSQLVPYDSSLLTSSESSGALAASWANLSLVEPGLGGSSTSSMFRPLFGLVYTNHTGATVDRFPFPVTTGGITLAEFGRTFTLVAEEYTSSSSFVTPRDVYFQFEKPFESTGSEFSGSLLAGAVWPTTISSTTSSTGGEPGYYVPTDDSDVPLWIGVTSSNMSRLTLTWDVVGGFSPLTVLVTMAYNTEDTTGTACAASTSVVRTTASTVPQVTLLQGESPATTINTGEAGVADVWGTTAEPVTTSGSGTTALTVSGLTWPDGTDLTNLTTGVPGGTTAFVPVVLELTVADALGGIQLYGKAYLRIYADEVPFLEARLLNGAVGIYAMRGPFDSDASSNPADNVAVQFQNLVCGGVWGTPADVGLTLVQPASSGSNTLAPNSFLISSNYDLAYLGDALGGQDVSTLSWTDLAGTEQTTTIPLFLIPVWAPTLTMFEPLIPGESPSSYVESATNTLYMFPDTLGNYAWPVSTICTVPDLPGFLLLLTFDNRTYIYVTDTFQLPSTSNSWSYTLLIYFTVRAWVSGPGSDSWNPRGIQYGSGFPLNILGNTAFTNTLICELAEGTTGSTSILTSSLPTQSGEVILSAFAPVGGVFNTWVYDPAGILNIPTNVPTVAVFTIVVVNADVSPTSSGLPSSIPTTDSNVGFYRSNGEFIGSSIQVVYDIVAALWMYVGLDDVHNSLSQITALAFAPFEGSAPLYESSSTKQYLLRVFSSAVTEAGTFTELSIDPRSLSTTPELFAAATVAGYNTAASGVFGFELQLALPATTVDRESLASSVTSSESSNSIYSVFQRFTGHTSSELGEPSEAFQCPDSVCFVLNPTPFLTSLSGYLAYSLETSWDGGSTWYILAHNLNGNALGDSFAGTGINGVLAGPWPERYVTLAADGSIPPWGVGSQVLMYRLGLQTSYGLHTLHRPFEYAHTLSVSSWRYSVPASDPADYTDVNTQFLDFHVPNNVQRFETTRYGLGDLSAGVLPYNAHQISVSPAVSSGAHVNLHYFRQ